MNNKIDLSNIPNKAGCYLWKNKKGNVIYIGKAKNLKSRMQQYFQNNVSTKTKVLVKHIDSFEYIFTKNELDALLLEQNLITQYNPKYNIRLKEDHKYPYINLRMNPQVKLRLSKIYKKDNSLYFGPFPQGFSPSKVIEILKSIYPINDCKNPGSGKACINYQLGLCIGYCVGEVTVHQRKEVFNKIKNFLEGKIEEVLSEVKDRMYNYSNDERYEEALILKKNVETLEQYREKQNIFFKDSKNRDLIAYLEKDGLISISMTYVRFGKVVDKKNKLIKSFNVDTLSAVEEYLIKYYNQNILPDEIITLFETNVPKALNINHKINPTVGLRKEILLSTQEHASEILKTKGKIFNLEDLIIEKALEDLEDLLQISVNEIEMIDISNLGGRNQVGGVINFKNGEPNKSKYRKYKLSDGQDDYGNIYEVTYRHFKKKLEMKDKLPTVYIIDGKHQIFSAYKALVELNIQKKITLISLVKNKKHQTDYIFFLNKASVSMPNELKQLFSKIQFEAHRFVITYQKSKRNI